MFQRKPPRKNNRRARHYLTQFFSSPEDHGSAPDDFMAAGNVPAWRSVLRFLVIGLMVLGAIYLSAISMNILILGTDDVDYSKHTDTIILVHWTPLPRRLALLSIPRDTFIQMPKRGPMKINAVYAYGNALGSRQYALAMTRASIETLLGVKIHYVIHIQYSNFIKLVDDLGGIPITVEKSMHYIDQAGGLNINLEPGPRILDGRQALDYVRFRHDAEGDIGRIRRQQKFLRAFTNQLLILSKAPNTFSAFYTFLHQVETNLNGATALFLALEIKGVAHNSWKQVILPGEPVFIEGKAYWKPDLQAIRLMMADLGRPAVKTPGQESAGARAPEGSEETTAASEPESKPEPGGQAAPTAQPNVAPMQIEPAANKPATAKPNKPLPAPRAQLPKPVIAQNQKPGLQNQAAPRSRYKPAAKRPLAPMPAGKQPAVRVLNGCGVPGVASRVTQRLLVNHVSVRAQDSTNAPNFNFGQTIIKSKAKNLPWAKRIATILNLGDDRIQMIPENITYPSVTIVIGGDYQELIK